MNDMTCVLGFNVFAEGLEAHLVKHGVRIPDAALLQRLEVTCDIWSQWMDRCACYIAMCCLVLFLFTVLVLSRLIGAESS